MIQFTRSTLQPEQFVIRYDGISIGRATDDSIMIHKSSKEAESFMTKEVIAEIKSEYKRVFPNGKISKILTLE